MNKKSSNWIPSTPGGGFMIPFEVFSILFVLYLAFKLWEEKAFIYVLICIAFVFLFIWIICHAVSRCACYIRLYDTYLVCVYPFRKIRLDYEKCTVGMEFSWVRGSKLWWIYLCYGQAPRFESKALNRINAMRCKEGFVRIMYRKEVYDELLMVLPKRQATALTTSKRCIPDLD